MKCLNGKCGKEFQFAKRGGTVKLFCCGSCQRKFNAKKMEYMNYQLKTGAITPVFLSTWEPPSEYMVSSSFTAPEQEKAA